VQTLRRLQSSRTVVIGIAGESTASSRRQMLIACAGPSGSGKSHFAQNLVNFLPGSTVISMDNYMQREKA
jgi:uridine kinase